MARGATFNFSKGRFYKITGSPRALLDYRRSLEYIFLQFHEIDEGLRHSIDVSAYAPISHAPTFVVLARVHFVSVNK